ncbi:hypothetical protein QBC40DRAFT_271733 [Triangularia verruculosa]|uniref:Uncharacterized protein n=1 Tax=Triangularia verruculosa TaxID=2587418 RepID=A0AAN6XR80_9PEZI|nr:hypothetical protein QBC40DRAFT_271733 [Triangularia verruculosa]
MSPIPHLKINLKRRFFDDDDDDDDDDNFNPPNWTGKSYNGPGSGYPGGPGDDNPILNGDFGGGTGERSNLDLDIDDRVITARNDGMDGGKIAAIVVSIVIFFSIVTGLCLWKDRRRKRRRLLEEEHRMADGGVKGNVYMKEQGEELSPMSAVSTQGVVGGTPVQVQGTDAPPPYEPRQPGAVHFAGGQPVAGGSGWRQSRAGAEEDDIMVTDGMPPDSGRQNDGKGSGGLQIGS